MPSDAITAAASSAALPTGATGPVSVKVVSGGESLPDLPDGATIEAQSVSRATKGTVEIQTSDGHTLQLKVQGGQQLPPVPPGSALLLQMQADKNGEMMLRLLAINGRPLGGSVTMAQLQNALPALQATDMSNLLGQNRAQQAAGNPTGAQALAPTSVDSAVGAGMGITATVIRNSVQATGNTQFGQPGSNNGGAGGNPQQQSGGLPFNLPAGTTFTVRLAAVGPQAQGHATASSGGIPTAGNTLARGDMLSLGSGLTMLRADGSSTLPPGFNGGSFLSATVISSPVAGRAVIQSPIGTLSIPTPGQLEPGTQLFLEVVGDPRPPQGATANGPRPIPFADSDGWPNLNQAMDTLANSNQAQALDQLMRLIPQDNTRLAAALATFTGALRKGDTKELTPDTVLKGLEKAGKKELAQNLKGDVDALAEQSNRPVAGGDWRAYSVPFLTGGIVEPVRLFVRRSGDDAPQRAGGTGNDQRFVLDLNLSRLGRFQLDGLVRREDKLFDLIIRTGEALSQDMRRDIMAIFTTAAEMIGTKGSVAFQAGGRWMEFPPTQDGPTRLEA